MTIPDNLDDAFDAFRALSARLDEALDACEKEQRAGRTGLDDYRRAATLQTQLNEFAARLAPRIEEARRSL